MSEKTCPRCGSVDTCLRPTCPHPAWSSSDTEQVEARGHWPGDGCGPATADHFAPPFGKGKP